MVEEQQQRFFDERAHRYDNVLFRSRWPRNQILKARLIADVVGPEALHGEVIELGCGTGQIAEALLDAHPELSYVGLDLSPAMVDAARRRLERFGGRVRVAGVGADVPVGASAAFGIDVLHHVPDPVQTLAELRSSVRSGARVAFLESNPKFPLTALYAVAHREEHAVLRFTRRRLHTFFERAGLTDVSVELGPLFTPPGPPMLIPVYDAIDALAARVPGLRALAIFYVAQGAAPA